MNPTFVGMIVFGVTLAGALLGRWLSTTLPEGHLNSESRESVKLAVGLIASMTALVLGLVTASAKSSFDDLNTAIKLNAMEVLTLDRLLARYGQETRAIRTDLQGTLELRIDELWPQGPSRPASFDPEKGMSSVEAIADRIRGLTPRDELQRSLQSRAVDIAEGLLQGRWIVSAGSSVSLPFLALLGVWLTVTFTIFGLLAPRNPTVLAVFVVCSLSVASAVFLIVEMDGPLDGVVKISADPFRFALARLNK